MKIMREVNISFEEFRKGLFSKGGRFERKELLKLLDSQIERYQGRMFEDDGYGWFKIILNDDMEPISIEQKRNDKPKSLTIAEVLEKLKYLVEIDELGGHFELIDRSKQ